MKNIEEIVTLQTDQNATEHIKDEHLCYGQAGQQNDDAHLYEQSRRNIENNGEKPGTGENNKHANRRNQGIDHNSGADDLIELPASVFGIQSRCVADDRIPHA